MIETSTAQSAASFVEHLYSLPQAHLSPAYGLEGVHRQAFIQHVRAPSSRFAVLGRYRDNWTFVISPWTTQLPSAGRRQRGVLFLQVFHNGIIAPLGWSSIRDEVPEGHRRSFWETLRQAASTNQEQLLRRFRVNRVVMQARA